MKFFALSLLNPDPNGDPIKIGKLGNSHIPLGGADSLSKILQTGYSLAIVLGVLFCLYVLLMSGRQYMMSGGDKQKMEQIRHRLSYAILGLVIIFLAYLVISILTNFFGFTIK